MKKIENSALNRLSVADFKSADKMEVVIILDNIRSGLNVGSVFRTADAFRVQKISLCGITVQPPHREVLKSALGSTASVEWDYFDSTIDAVKHCQGLGYQVFAVEQTEPRIWLHEIADRTEGRKIALVFGNEVEGVDEKVIQQCSGALEIPQLGTKHSLNVSVSVGIVLWEFAKIRALKDYFG